MKLFFLFFKRNFKHFSFILILLLMPFVTLFMKEIVKSDDSVLKIGFTASGVPDNALCQVFSKIENDGGIIDYLRYDSEKEGRYALDSAEIDCLWIFEADLENALSRYCDNKRNSVVTVLNREENDMQDMALEKLFCFIYPHLSYTLFEDYMTDKVDGGDLLQKESLRDYYGYKGIDSEIVEIRTVDGDGKESREENNFILSAVRGILSLIVLLSALTSALHIKEDDERGLFIHFKPLKRLALYFGGILSALIPTGAVFFASVLMSGTFIGTLKELMSLIVLILTSASLCLALVTLSPTKKALCIIFPMTLTAAAVMSPIFLNVRAFPVIQALFPTYHYLYSLTDPREYVYSLLYFVLTLGVAILRQYFTVGKDKNMLTR